MSKSISGPALLLVAASAACGSSEPSVNDGGNTIRWDCGAPPSDAAPPDPGHCQPTVASHPVEGVQHLPVCSPLTYATNPPSSGNHYVNWAAYRTYERAIPRGFWVHSLEHGAVVFTYHCPGGCPAEIAEVQALINGLPADCGADGRRVILTPDPDLDVRFGASAWGWTLRANCFDKDAFTTFFTEHYDRAPESICGGGVDPTDLCGPSMCP